MSTQLRTRRKWRGRLVRSATGVADVLTAPHGVDRWVELVEPTWSSRDVRGRVVAVRRTTADSVTMTVRPNRNWLGFEAGQHVLVTVEINGVRQTRCYSMCSSATDSSCFELTVKGHPHGTVSRYLVDEAEPGLVVGLSPAQGEFTLPAARPERLLLLSGGSGITPVLSMLRTLCAEGHAGQVTFVHYALTPSDHLLKTEAEELAAAHDNVELVRVYTDTPGAGDLDGFLDEAQLEAIDPLWTTTPAFVCGPAPLMASARRLYEAAGAGDLYHDESFTLASLVAEAGPVGGTVSFTGTGTTVGNDGRPLLVQAEDAGLRPASGCRMGICHTCVRPLPGGTVQDAVTGELTEGGTDVSVRICVSVPVGDVALDL